MFNTSLPLDQVPLDQISPNLHTRPALTRQAWAVGALCLAISDNLQARFNPLAVRGEISGFTQASSGHCYFTLKDQQGQLRCAMFKRAAAGLQFQPQNGNLVEVSGKLGVYEQRGELQLVVDSMSKAGQGGLMEEFLRLKDRLNDQGLFDPQRKRLLSRRPRGIGVVTSLDAAAWHDVMTALQRRAPHVPVVLATAKVQGSAAPQELIHALHALYALIEQGRYPLDVILLVRGGGALEDLWAFNDEQLAYTIARSPVPVISGVGHETDFSISDFVADVRAATPTAAAELCSLSTFELLSELNHVAQQLNNRIEQVQAQCAQHVDELSRRLKRPSDALTGYQHRLEQWALRLHQGGRQHAQNRQHAVGQLNLRLNLLHPQKVLDRGYAWVSNQQGGVVKNAADLSLNQTLSVHLSKGRVSVQVV